jgi:hypothetical protein
MNTQPDTTTLAGKIAVMQAAAEGKRIEIRVRHGGNWCIDPTPQWDWIMFLYRVHPDDLNPPPTPKLRPWRPEEVPLGALIQCKGGGCWRTMIVGYNQAQTPSVLIPDGRISPETLFNFDEHSLDGGRTWLPCGVLDEG